MDQRDAPRLSWVEKWGTDTSDFATHLGQTSLTAETALRLEAVLGIDAGTWMNLQAACEIWQAKQTKPARGLKRLAALKTA